MIRLLVALLVLGLAVYWVNTRTTDEKPEVLYKENVDKAEQVEETLREGADARRRHIDRDADQ